MRLECLQADHADMVFEAMQDVHLYRYIPQDPPSRDQLHKRYRFLEAGESPDGQEYWLNWVAFLDQTQTVVGTCQATVPKDGEVMIAYMTFTSFWRQGYAKEMIQSMITYLFKTYNSSHLYAEIDTRNIGSIRLIESLGFEQVQFIKAADFFKEAPSDEYKYMLNRDTWWTRSL